MRFDCPDFLQDTGACILNGEQELVLLGFDKHTVSYPMFGMSMVLLGFLAAGFFFLVNSKLKFMPMGNKGQLYAKWAAGESQDDPAAPAKGADTSV